MGPRQSALIRELKQKREYLLRFRQLRAETVPNGVNGQTISVLNREDSIEYAAREAELAELERQRTFLIENERRGQYYTSGNDVLPEPGLWRRLKDSWEFRDRRRENRYRFKTEFYGVDFKALFATTSGFAPANPRTSVVNLVPAIRPFLADVIPADPTTLGVVKYMRGVSKTENAASTSEGAAKPESGYVYEEASAPLTKISHWIPVTEEALEDAYGLRNVLENQMLNGLRVAEEDKLLNGPGGGFDFEGFYNVDGVGTQAKGADTLVDAVYKAIQYVFDTGKADASAVAIHPDDLDAIRLAKNELGDYIWGPPSLPFPETMWGLPIVRTASARVGKPLVGDYINHAHISRREEGSIEVTDSYADYFAKDILVIVAELRASLEVLRPSAFCYVVS